jgi:serine/threonine protein kinase
MEVVAGAAGGLLQQLIINIVAAARALKMFKHKSKRLAGRITVLSSCLLSITQDQQAYEEVHDLLQSIAGFLEKLRSKSRISKFVHFDEVASKFQHFNSALDDVKGDLMYVKEGLAYVKSDELEQQAEDSQDIRDDFDLLQAVNYRELPPAEAEAVNKELQLMAPKNLVGFEEIEYSSLEKEHLLGEGSFSRVYQAQWKDMVVAVKILDYTGREASLVKAIRRELRVHASPQALHERVVELFGACTVPTHYAIVMEHTPYGTLHELLFAEEKEYEREQLSTEHRLQMLHDIADGLKHLHSHKIVHGDIKSTNALLFKGFRVKICDFGLATMINTIRNTTSSTETKCGTHGHMAPEILDGGSSTFASDVYSYSMIIYETVTEKRPYPVHMDAQVIMNLTNNGKRPHVEQSAVIDGCLDMTVMMKACWQQLPIDRPTFSNIVRNISILRANLEHSSSTTTPLSESQTLDDSVTAAHQSTAAHKAEPTIQATATATVTESSTMTGIFILLSCAVLFDYCVHCVLCILKCTCTSSNARVIIAYFMASFACHNI